MPWDVDNKREFISRIICLLFARSNFCNLVDSAMLGTTFVDKTCTLAIFKGRFLAR